MRRWLIPVLLVLPLAHCSCQRDPAAASHAGNAAPATAAAPGGEAASTTADETAPAIPAGLEAAQQAISTLHAYLGALPGPDRAAANAYWAGGNPGSPAGDEALRDIPDLRGLRIDNDVPKPLDRESPPRAFEIPVRLRVDTATARFQLRGNYRLRARVDGRGWEITSAELRPALD